MSSSDYNQVYAKRLPRRRKRRCTFQTRLRTRGAPRYCFTYHTTYLAKMFVTACVRGASPGVATNASSRPGNSSAAAASAACWSNPLEHAQPLACRTPKTILRRPLLLRMAPQGSPRRRHAPPFASFPARSFPPEGLRPANSSRSRIVKRMRRGLMEWSGAGALAGDCAGRPAPSATLRTGNSKNVHRGEKSNINTSKSRMKPERDRFGYSEMKRAAMACSAITHFNNDHAILNLQTIYICTAAVSG